MLSPTPFREETRFSSKHLTVEHLKVDEVASNEDLFGSIGKDWNIDVFELKKRFEDNLFVRASNFIFKEIIKVEKSFDI